ncbi:MAG: hypothetical protein AAF808_16375 [Cyanobacteria bacterium P01_D01_bin.2]
MVWSVAFSPDGLTLASGSDDHTVKLWSVAQHTEVATLQGHESLVYAVAFSPDGLTLASGSGDNTVKLWSVAQHTELATLQGHENGVSAVAFSPDGLTLASGSGDEITRLWDLKTGNCIAVFDDRLCAGLDITGATGLTEAQRTALQLLGAVDHDQSEEID